MPVFSIDYDVSGQEGQDNTDLINALEFFKAHCHALESSWLVATQWTINQVRNHLSPYLHKTDKLVIKQIEKTSDWTVVNAPEAEAFLAKWVKKHQQTPGPRKLQ